MSLVMHRVGRQERTQQSERQESLDVGTLTASTFVPVYVDMLAFKARCKAQLWRFSGSRNCSAERNRLPLESQAAPA